MAYHCCNYTTNNVIQGLLSRAGAALVHCTSGSAVKPFGTLEGEGSCKVTVIKLKIKDPVLYALPP
jgi:hypothetical protein